MAPEQVEGRRPTPAATSGRSAWVYEMATGTGPFDGDHPPSVIGAILKDTPRPMSNRQPLRQRWTRYSAVPHKDPDGRGNRRRRMFQLESGALRRVVPACFSIEYRLDRAASVGRSAAVAFGSPSMAARPPDAPVVHRGQGDARNRLLRMADWSPDGSLFAFTRTATEISNFT